MPAGFEELKVYIVICADHDPNLDDAWLHGQLVGGGFRCSFEKAFEELRSFASLAVRKE